jgi:hypothetical protein
MAPKTPISPLAIVDRPELSPPPRPLGKAGTELWNAIQREYFLVDSGGTELLMQAAAVADRISGLSAEIERTGLTIPTKEGFKSNPLLREELGARALLTRILQRLGVTDESIRPVGRPSHGGRHAY